MRSLLPYFAFALLAGSNPTGGADYQDPTPPERISQRRSYLDALELIRTNQFTRYERLKPSLKSYALYPYVEYREHLRRLSRKTGSDILTFSERYRDTPLVEPLMRQWLAHLAKRGDWADFLAHYDRVEPTGLLACHQGYALYKAGQIEEMMQAVTKLWLVDFSQPDECDPAFKAWREKGGLTPELAWQRYSLALRANRTRLADYLVRFLDESDLAYANNFRRVRSRPGTIKHTGAFSRNHPRNHDIVLHGVTLLAKADPEDALATLDNYRTQHDFNPEALEEAYRAIGLRLAGQPEKTDLVTRLPIKLRNHPGLVEAGIRQSLRLADWRNVFALINLLPEERKASSGWRYWTGRLLAADPDMAGRKAATAIFEELSRERSFYGFLSADILGYEYSFEDEPLDITGEQISSLEQRPGIERALELLAVGQRSQARREWSHTTRDFTLAERQVAARVAGRRGWYKAAIQTMIDAKAWNHLDVRFPLAYQEQFTTHSRNARIPVQWSLAVARQESAFMPDAKSSSGALGLMQLMPSTAKAVARNLGTTYRNNRSLISPDLNIRLGTHYLGQMSRRYGNNRILASAAYNAGPGRVDRWLDPSVPLDVWVETIPFRETRNYVRNVLMFAAIYQRRLNQPGPFIHAHERDAFKKAAVVLQPSALRPPGE